MATTTDPNQSYYQQVQSELGSLTGLLGASVAPQIAQSQLQYQAAEQQAAMAPAEEAQAANYQQLMSGYQLGGLGIQAQQQALQQQGLQQQYGLQQQSYQQQAEQNQLAYVRQLQNQIGGAASSGALGTVGNRQAQSDIAQNYAWQQAALGREEALSAGDYARAQQNFQLLSQANGLSQQEVYARLSYGLSQLGLEYDPTTIMAQAGQALSGEAQAQGIGGVLSQAGLLGGLNTVSGITGT